MNYRALTLWAVVLTCFSTQVWANDPTNPAKAIITISDEQGNALAGVRVSESETAGQYTTDAKGQFACEVSNQVRYFYAVDGHRKLAEAERLESGGEQLSMKLAPARVVSGRVTDPNGRFIANHLPDTRYSVIVEPGSESPYATTVLRGGASCGAKDLRVVVKHKAEVKATTSLIGTSIWQLAKASLPLEESKCRGKAILVCLFDMNQRPSRNCLRQRSEKAREFEARDVVIAAVQVPAVDQAEFDKWTGESNVSFPLSILRNVESPEFAASCRESLPRLILTDSQHKVVAEGFATGELDSKLEEAKP